MSHESHRPGRAGSFPFPVRGPFPQATLGVYWDSSRGTPELRPPSLESRRWGSGWAHCPTQLSVPGMTVSVSSEEVAMSSWFSFYIFSSIPDMFEAST